MSRLTDEEVIAAFHEAGTRQGAADRLGVNVSTVYRRLKKLDMLDELATGHVAYREPIDLELPEPGQVKTYILTAVQNNTKVHKPLLRNLEAYADFLKAEIMVARFTYNKASYSNSKSVKPGRRPTAAEKEEAWYDSAVESYICDDPDKHGSCRWRLAPGLVWCSEMNILPTRLRPLTGLGNYTGRESSIFPHATIALESVANPMMEATKLMYTTGTVTQRNYIAKATGLTAEARHSYGALIVEVDHTGSWWVRQLYADDSGAFYDTPDGFGRGCIRMAKGQLTSGHRLEAINWGDVHASEMDYDVAQENWGEDGLLDQVWPRYQIMHDLLNFRSRSHHDFKSFGDMLKKHVNGVESVAEECRTTAEFANWADRADIEMVVVNSNHDRHGERWLDEADYRRDLLNAEFFLEGQLARVKAIKAGVSWDFHRWALDYHGVSQDIRFLDIDESFVICRKHYGGVELSLHGDLGPNGSRGSTQNLQALGRRVNKGHDHTATIRGDVYSAGKCPRHLSYEKGPSSHSISHIFTYANASRAIVTSWKGKWRAARF